MHLFAVSIHTFEIGAILFIVGHYFKWNCKLGVLYVSKILINYKPWKVCSCIIFVINNLLFAVPMLPKFDDAQTSKLDFSILVCSNVFGR